MPLTTAEFWATTLALLLCVLVAACEGDALRMNASIAHVMLETQAESGPVIRELRQNAMRNAAREAYERGQNEFQARDAAGIAAIQWECAVNGHRLYATAVGTYIDAIALWMAGKDFQLYDAVPFVRRVLDTYRVMQRCLSSLGQHILPEVPGFADMLPAAWNLGGASGR